MILREILRTLERIEEKIAPNAGQTAGADRRAAEEADEWMQAGIDSILSYQAGKKEEKQ